MPADNERPVADPTARAKTEARLPDWLVATELGLWCEPGGFYIDPHRAVERAVITHGHSDHARPGHATVLATAATADIIRARLGDSIGSLQPASYGERLRVGDVSISLLPAGHILGSAQALLEYRGCRVVVSGDFKCQRLIALLREAGYDRTIFLHGALAMLCELYERQGIGLGPLALAGGDRRKALAGEIVLCPPSALADRWARAFPDPVIAMASGWMRIRQRARQRGIELPLVISDHADWLELTQTLDEVAAPVILVTHGREEALVHHAQKCGHAAAALSLSGYDEDSA